MILAPLRAAAARANQAPPAVRGILLALASGAFFASMHGSVRLLSRDLDAFEIAFFRALFGFLFFAPLLLRTRLSTLRTRRLPLHLLRGVFNGGSLLCWFTALSLVPLGEATALSLLGPAFVALGAAFCLGEKAGGARWLAIAAGFAGALVIIRPGFQETGFGMLLVLVSMLLVTCSKLIAKSLARTDDPSTIVAYLSLTMMAPSGVAAILVWRTPTLGELAVLALIGALASCGHLLLTAAYKVADISAVEPIVYARMVWAALVGWLMLGEFPGLWTWAGAAVIIASSALLARFETRPGGGSRTPA